MHSLKTSGQESLQIWDNYKTVEEKKYSSYDAQKIERPTSAKGFTGQKESYCVSTMYLYLKSGVYSTQVFLLVSRLALHFLHLFYSRLF